MGPETHFSGTVCSVPSCCHGDLGMLQPVVVGAELVKNQEGGRAACPIYSPETHPKSFFQRFCFYSRKENNLLSVDLPG